MPSVPKALDQGFLHINVSSTVAFLLKHCFEEHLLDVIISVSYFCIFLCFAAMFPKFGLVQSSPKDYSQSTLDAAKTAKYYF